MLNPLPGTNNTACNVGYSSTCGTGNCKCTMFTGSGRGSAFGSSSNVSLALTADVGASTVANACFPVFVSISIPGSKDSETIDVSATLCSTIDRGLQLSGGFQFTEPSSKGLAAVGTVTANAPTTQPSKLQIKLKGKGLIAPPPP